MYYNIIKNYINKMTINDLKSFMLKENIYINDQDLKTIYNYIKIYFNEIINNPPLMINNIKDNIEKSSYKNIIFLYNKYKDKLNLLK